MAATNHTEHYSFWEKHVTAWEASGLNQKAYSNKHGLRYSAFGYWVRKLRRKAGAETKQSSFVPVMPAKMPSTAGLTLSLPNGLEIRGIETQNLPVVKQLLEVL